MNKGKGTEAILTGYRVLDVTDEKGLLCGKVLGDLGADVLKIEPPGGSAARDIGPFYKDIPDREKSLFWFFTNTSKRGITLNLETADGRDIFKRLVKTAHFVIESYEPGCMAGLGLGYEDLEKINPGLVMTSITPFGQAGPYAHYKAADLTLAAMGGHMQLFGEGDRAPLRIGQPQAFFHGGLQGAMGSMVAHYHRELTGEGQHVDVSCQQALSLTLMNAIEQWDISRRNIKRAGAFSMMGVIAHRRIWPCKDGHVCFFVAGGAALGARISSELVTKWANEEGFARAIKDMDWSEFDYALMSKEQWDTIENAFQSFLNTKTKAELFKEAVAKSLMICPVNMAKDVLGCPQLSARDYWAKVEHEELGDTITYPEAPVKMAEAPWRIRRRAPLIGEHNEEIYVSELGFTAEQLVTMKACRII
jgi:crotonobetainyl-CoA:carnitine CoA-transferase CaiB-like acyl-CoA transferase